VVRVIGATRSAFPPFHAEIRRLAREHCPGAFGRIIELEAVNRRSAFTNMSGDHEKEDFADGMSRRSYRGRPYPLAPVSGLRRVALGLRRASSRWPPSASNAALASRKSAGKRSVK